MVKLVSFMDTKVIEGKNYVVRKMAGVNRKLHEADSQLFTVLGIIIIAAVLLGLFLTFGKSLFGKVTVKVDEETMKLFNSAPVAP